MVVPRETLEQIAAMAPKPEPSPRRNGAHSGSDFERSATRWNQDHRIDFPRHCTECPICGSPDGLKESASDPSRWCCFSSRHQDLAARLDAAHGLGVAGHGVFTGDALDVEAFTSGRTRAEVLRAAGYLHDRDSQQTPPRDDQQGQQHAEDDGIADWQGWDLEEVLQLPPVEWLAEPLVPAASVVMLGGAPTVGKSYLAIDFIMRLVHGCEQWMGAALRYHGPVAYLALEGHAGLAGRIRAWRKHHQGLKQLHAFKLFNPTASDEAPPLALIAQKWTLRRLHRFKQKHGGLALVVIDTLTLATDGDENDAGEMRAALRLAARIAVELGCTVLLLHHLRKDLKEEPTLADLRGSGAFGGNVDQVLLAWVDKHKTRLLKAEKAKDGSAGSRIAFALDVIDTGITRKDGKPESACVARHAGDARNQAQQVDEKMKTQQAEAQARQRLLEAATSLTVPVSADELCERAKMSAPKTRHLVSQLADEGALGRLPYKEGRYRFALPVLVEQLLQAAAAKRSRPATGEQHQDGDAAKEGG